MVKIIVAFAAKEKCEQCAAVLEGAGLSVYRRCTSQAEVRRAFNQCGDGILVTAYRLKDGTADELAWDLGRRAIILITGPQAQVELSECPDVFRLPTPCTRGELASAVNMLVQLHRMNLPRKSDQERQTIAQAKEALMRMYGLDEPQAHRYLQKGAMDRGMKAAEFAARILKQINDNGGEEP